MSPTIRLLSCLVLLACGRLAAQTTTPEVGGNAPSEFVRSRFTAAYSRNQFYLLTFPTPVADVTKLGTAGVIQLFFDPVKTSNVRLALIKADANASFTVDAAGNIVGGDVYQVLSTMWAYLASANGTSATAPSALNTTGFPTIDTAACAPVGDIGCYYQTFDKKYVLFSYAKALTATAGQNMALREPFYSVWIAAGGLSGLGSAVFAELAVVSPVSASTAIWQQYSNGAIVSVTSGVLNTRVVTVRQPVYDLYVANGGPTGFLGYPTGEARSLANGNFRQAFEGGTIEYAPGGSASLLLPVYDVNVPNAGAPLRLSLGDSTTLNARLFAANGDELSDRPVTWTTSNARVVAIEGGGSGVGLSATLRAVGGGVATIKAVSEGKSSVPITVYVSAPCCQAGEGAPAPSIAQAIVDALNRNKLQVRIPTPTPVRRLGPGHVQEFLDASNAAPYLVAVPDNVTTGYLVRGPILTTYNALGATAGSLGFPLADASPGGRQLFANHSALAGSPVRLVQSGILDKWASLGYETGAAGSPTSDPAPFSTFTASAGYAQSFDQGAIYAASGGALAGRGFFVSGPLYTQFISMSGPGGDLGMPVSDEVIIDGARRQDFEGGLLDLPPGESQVRVTLKNRTPSITATPNPVTAGGRVRLSAGGFPAGAQLRVTVTGQPDFVVSVPSGSFAWESAVPASSASATVQVRAAAVTGESAQGSFRIRSLTDAEPRLSKVGGDGQSGVPGALLAEPFRIALRDSAGNPVPGVPVIFQASPGAAIERFDLLTDTRGEASATLRLPASDAVALATATAARLVVTFQARSAPLSLPNFPKLRQNFQVPLGRGSATIAERGALLASLANIIRFHQDQGQLPLPNGPADVLVLNNYLTGLCTPLASSDGASLCDGFIQPATSDDQIVNLFRIPAFLGGAAGIETGPPTMEAIRDWVASGSPVLVSFRMTAGGAPAGMHHIVATAVAANGGIPAFDPGDFFLRDSVNAFLSEFSAGGRTWSASIASIARIVPRSASTAGFHVRSTEPFTLLSPAGACAPSFPWLDRAATATSNSAQLFLHASCDGAAPQYQLAPPAGAPAVLTITSAASPASTTEIAGSSVYRISGGPQWRPAPQTLEVDVSSPPLNAANLTPDIGPGSLIALFGAGFVAPGLEVAADINGSPAAVSQSSPFRLNVVVPPDAAPGAQFLRIASPLGAAEVPLNLLPAAPAIFESTSGAPLIRNEDGSLNTPETPARRGRPISVYSTGLGLISGGQPALPLRVLFGEVPLEPQSVGLVPELPGVYEIRLTVPPATPPAAHLQLVLQQGGQSSKPVLLAVE
jgi:uncharacterized protein (TIGR03437 family)